MKFLTDIVNDFRNMKVKKLDESAIVNEKYLKRSNFTNAERAQQIRRLHRSKSEKCFENNPDKFGRTAFTVGWDNMMGVTERQLFQRYGGLVIPRSEMVKKVHTPNWCDNFLDALYEDRAITHLKSIFKKSLNRFKKKIINLKMVQDVPLVEAENKKLTENPT